MLLTGVSINVWVPHLHHDTQVFDVVFLRLNQLLQNKPEQTKRKQRTVTTAEDTAGHRHCGRGRKSWEKTQWRWTHIRPLIALALCSSSGFRGWTGVLCSGGEREVKPGYAPGSRVWREETRAVFKSHQNLRQHQVKGTTEGSRSLVFDSHLSHGCCIISAFRFIRFNGIVSYSLSLYTRCAGKFHNNLTVNCNNNNCFSS